MKTLKTILNEMLIVESASVEDVDSAIDKHERIIVNYHTKGEEIYYNFFQDKKELERDSLIANVFAHSTGYAIKNVEKTSSGGLKDYLVQSLKIPAITIELTSDDLSHPIKEENLPDIFLRNKNIANDLIKAYNIFNKFKGK